MEYRGKRLGHKKSRTGCVRCKQRHVKCDEQRPCSACLRFGEVCSLLLDQAQHHPESHKKKSPAPTPRTARSRSKPSTGSCQPQQPTPDNLRDDSTAPTSPPNELPLTTAASPSTPASWKDDTLYIHSSMTWMQSLRLIHHYDTAVWQTISHNEETRNIWRFTVPQTAFANEYLMHGLLAVSALHYAQAHPDERDEYILISTHYSSLALQYFTTQLGDITQENFEPAFFLATCIFMWTLYSFSDPHPSAKPVTTAEIAQSFKLLHGIKSIFDSRPEGWVADGPLEPLFQQWDVDVKVVREGPFHMQMDKIYELARDLTPSFDIINTQSSCLLAIETLRTTYAACCSGDLPKHAQRIWFWPATLTQVFVDLISSNHPVALVILAHYAALARSFENWNQVSFGWGVKALNAIESCIDDEWRKWIAWPAKSLREGIDVYDMELHDTQKDGQSSLL